MNLNFFKRKKKEENFPTEITTELPDELERFRTRGIDPTPPVGDTFAKPLEFVNETEKRVVTQDKSDLILQKLETIDVRLKLLEEKLGV